VQRISTLMQFMMGERAISARQRELLDAQSRVSSGRRIGVPSDDPIGAATSAALHAGLSQLDQFGSNQSHAQYLLSQGESAVTQVSDVLQQAKEKLLGAANGTVDDSQRQMYARDLEGLLAQMVGIANTVDGVGGFLFAGAREGAAPFGQSGTTVSFSGDDNAQRIEVSNNRYLRVKLTGDDVFLKLRPGNGTFTTAAAASNTGAGIIDTGAVIDPSQITGSDYTIDFNGTQFVVTRASDNAQFTFAPAATGATALQFDGLRVSISGTPANGDRFTVQPAGYQSIFDTLAQTIAALRTPAPNAAARARISSLLGGAGASLDQAAVHLQLKRTEIGAALAEVDGYQKMREDRSLQYQGRLSEIEDVDYAAAITELTRRQSTFEAAIKSYSSVSKLSLFDYL